MDKKFICPNCGSNVQYWEELYYEIRRSINPTSGIVGTRCTRTSADNIGTRGIRCTACQWWVSLNDPSCDEVWEQVSNI